MNRVVHLIQIITLKIVEWSTDRHVRHEMDQLTEDTGFSGDSLLCVSVINYV